MRKLATSILVTTILILFVSFAFTLYAQFALDYSLESLRQALQVSQKETPTALHSRIYYASLDRLVIEELAQKQVNFREVILLEHAARSIREAVEQSSYARASVYLGEVLKEKNANRVWYLRIGDSVYSFIQSFLQGIRNFWNYLIRRIQGEPVTPPLKGSGLLLLAEAEKMERTGKLKEAEHYYREFLNRHANRPERGFVSISLAHLMIKMRRLEEADELLQSIRREFAGGREEIMATDLLIRIGEVKRQLARLPQLENWVKSAPERIFEETVGLELVLAYLKTYQMDKALAILKKLEEAPDADLRAKALFYQAWILKWQGDLEKGRELFQALLTQGSGLDEELELALRAELAIVHQEAKEYERALKEYEELSKMAVAEGWRSLLELEKSEIFLSPGIGKVDKVREQLQRLESVYGKNSIELRVLRLQLEEALQRGSKEEGLVALIQGQVDRALQHYEDYLKKFPLDGSAHSTLATIYLLKGLLREAIEEAETGFALEHSEYTAAVLAYVYEKAGRLDEAEAYYFVSIQIKPNVTAHYNLARVYLLTERYKEANNLLLELEESKSVTAPSILAKVLNNRGCALWFLGRKNEALQKFEEALKVSPALIEAQSNLHLGAGEKPVSR